MAVAIISLPVPVSPSSSTEAFVLATLRVSRYTASIAGLLPISPAMGGPVSLIGWLIHGWRSVGLNEASPRGHLAGLAVAQMLGSRATYHAFGLFGLATGLQKCSTRKRRDIDRRPTTRQSQTARSLSSSRAELLLYLPAPSIHQVGATISTQETGQIAGRVRLASKPSGQRPRRYPRWLTVQRLLKALLSRMVIREAFQPPSQRAATATATIATGQR